MPAGPITIDPGDALPATFTVVPANGTAPFSYVIAASPTESQTGLSLAISGGNNEVANLVSTGARPGFSGDVRLTVTATDDLGDQAQATDHYTVTVNPIVASWDVGSLTIPSMEQDATSAETATLARSAGGAIPFTYSFDWASGSPPAPGMTITVTGGDTVAITTGATTPPGTYNSVIRGIAIDNNGYQLAVDLSVSVVVEGLRGFAWSPTSLSASANVGTEVTTGVATIIGGSGGVGPYTYITNFFPTIPPNLTLNRPTAQSVSVTAPDSLSVDVYSGFVRGEVVDANGQRFVLPDLSYSIAISIPTGNTLEATIIALGATSWWPLDETSGDYLDGGANSYDLQTNGSATNAQKIYQLPGLARREPRVYGAWAVSGFGYGNPQSALPATGYSGSAFTAGSGIGVLAHLSSHSISQWPIYHTFDGGSSRHVGIRVDPNGTISFRMNSAGQYFVTASSVAGVFPFGEPAVLYGKMGDDVSQEAQIFLNGVDVTDSVISGTSSNNYDSFATLISGSGASGVGYQIGMLNASAGSPQGTNVELTGIVSMPHMFVGVSLTDAQVASIYDSAGYGGAHDDYLEYMLDKVGKAKVYWPGLDSYAGAVSITPVVTNTDSSSGSPRFQAGVDAAIEDDDSRIALATVYPSKKKWDQTGSDQDAYLRNWGAGSEVPMCEVGEPGTSGVIGLTVNVIAQPTTTGYVNFTSGGTDQIYAWFESGVGSDTQMHFRVQLSGVIQFEAALLSDPDLILNNVILFHWVKRVGTDYQFYINGRNITGNLTVTTNVSQANWFNTLTALRGTNHSSYLMGGLVDYGHQSHDYFYLNDVEWTDADVLEHYNAQNGVFS